MKKNIFLVMISIFFAGLISCSGAGTGENSFSGEKIQKIDYDRDSLQPPPPPEDL